MVVRSTGDSLDMLSDALVDGASLAIVSRSFTDQKMVARIAGAFQLLLGAGVRVETLRKVVTGYEPATFAIIALALPVVEVNLFVLQQLGKHRTDSVYLNASWLFTRNDVLANFAVVAAVLLVMGTKASSLIF